MCNIPVAPEWATMETIEEITDGKGADEEDEQ